MFNELRLARLFVVKEDRDEQLVIFNKLAGVVEIEKRYVDDFYRLIEKVKKMDSKEYGEFFRNLKKE